MRVSVGGSCWAQSISSDRVAPVLVPLHGVLGRALSAFTGMSSRAIAPVVGANYATVTRDIKSVASATDAPRTVKSLDGVDRTFQPRTVRPLAVEQMRRERLTQQQIADKLNVGQSTVDRDLRRLNTQMGNGSLPETITDSRGQERPGPDLDHLANVRKMVVTCVDVCVDLLASLPLP